MNIRRAHNRELNAIRFVIEAGTGIIYTCHLHVDVVVMKRTKITIR